MIRGQIRIDRLRHVHRDDVISPMSVVVILYRLVVRTYYLELLSRCSFWNRAVNTALQGEINRFSCINRLDGIAEICGDLTIGVITPVMTTDLFGIGDIRAVLCNKRRFTQHRSTYHRAGSSEFAKIKHLLRHRCFNRSLVVRILG